MFLRTIGVFFVFFVLATATVQAADGPLSDAANEQILSGPGTAIAPATTERTGRLVLTSLYGSLAGLHAYDAYSTLRGVEQGARELNPVMQAVSGNGVAMVAFKSGMAAVSIAVSERLWRRNQRSRAVMVMLLTNGILAAVTARNAQVLHQ